LLCSAHWIWSRVPVPVFEDIRAAAAFAADHIANEEIVVATGDKR
jgi:hypothetical protein